MLTADDRSRMSPRCLGRMSERDCATQRTTMTVEQGAADKEETIKRNGVDVLSHRQLRIKRHTCHGRRSVEHQPGRPSVRRVQSFAAVAQSRAK